jgi:hypothetical protein
MKFAHGLKDQIGKNEGQAILSAVTGMQPHQLKEWLLKNGHLIPKNQDGTYSQETLAMSLLMLRQGGTIDRHALQATVAQNGPRKRVLGPLYPLYEVKKGGLPEDQDWWYLTDPMAGKATQMVVNAGVRLDTTRERKDKAGFFTEDPISGEMYRHPAMPMVNRDQGFTVRFDLHLLKEKHVRDDRAGFSIILLGQDLTGIELGFWEGRIWAQADNGKPIFQDSRAESCRYDTTADRVRYEVTLFRDDYLVRVGNQTLLKGPLRNYAHYGGFPYDTPNFLFLGDNTTSASAAFELGGVELEELGVLKASAVLGVGITPAYAALYLSRESGLHPKATMGYMRNRADEFPPQGDGTYAARLVLEAGAKLRALMASAPPAKKEAVNKKYAAKPDETFDQTPELSDLTPDRILMLLEAAPAALQMAQSMSDDEEEVIHRGVDRLEDWSPEMLGASEVSTAQRRRGVTNRKGKVSAL